MTPEQALREAIDHTRFIADHLEGRMGDGALADMLMMADEWEGAIGRPSEAEARAERAEAETVRLRADNEFLRKRRGQLVIERDRLRETLPGYAGTLLELARVHDALGYPMEANCIRGKVNQIEQACDEPTPEQAQDELVREGQERGEYGEDALEDTDNLELLRDIENSEGDGTEEALTPYGAKCVADELERLRELTSADKPCPHVRTSAEGTSYCTLAESASAVPYVPEQIRRLPEKWRKVAANTRVMSLLEPADEAAADIYDQCAQELERALDPAPAVPDRDSLQFGVTRDCRVFVGYVNRDEEGGFTVLAWAPDWVTTKGGE